MSENAARMATRAKALSLAIHGIRPKDVQLSKRGIIKQNAGGEAFAAAHR